MKKYLSFFRLRFIMGLQYRSAAIAGILTQFFWGFMEVLIYKAFYEAEPWAFPMTFSAMVSYIWIQQAFLAFFMAWFMEAEIFEVIVSGNIAYELCRPISIYNMWFSRSLANRLSRAVLRCFPILIIASCLPEPYNLTAPKNMMAFSLFFLTMVIGLFVMVAFCMLIYVLTFFTVSQKGLYIVFVSSVEFFSGAVIPLPFFPEKIRKIFELLPFAAMQNVPLRIYSGDLAGKGLRQAIILQILWLLIFLVVGKVLCSYGEKRVTIQGG